MASSRSWRDRVGSSETNNGRNAQNAQTAKADMSGTGRSPRRPFFAPSIRGARSNGFAFQRAGVWPQSCAVVKHPPPPLGPLVRSIAVDDLRLETTEARITGATLVGSYNWVGKREPLIITPGGAPRWTPPAQPKRLSCDSGLFFRDTNAAHFAYPFEPIVHAVQGKMDKEGLGVLGGLGGLGGLGPIDVVACSSTLGSLLRFVRRGDLDDRDRQPFRIVAERDEATNTVFLVRRENAPDECIEGVVGYGHTYPASCTTWTRAARGSTSHQRLLTYRFGGLRLLVRFEADGCFSDTMTGEDVGLDTLMSKMTLGRRAKAAAGADQPPKLLVKHAGRLCPQDSVFDIKTRSMRKIDERNAIVDRELPRLWCRQIPFLVLAFHQSGLFATDNTEIVDVRDRVRDWETAHQPDLQALAALLKFVVAETTRAPDGVLEIVHAEDGGSGGGADDEDDVGDILSFHEPGDGVPTALSEAGRSCWADLAGSEPERKGLLNIKSLAATPSVKPTATGNDSRGSDSDSTLGHPRDDESSVEDEQAAVR